MTWLQLPMEMQYYANLLSAWLSPLQHATYTMHNFGYDLLPRVHTSYLILGGTSVALMIVSAIAMRRFSFNFTGGYLPTWSMKQTVQRSVAKADNPPHGVFHAKGC